MEGTFVSLRPADSLDLETLFKWHRDNPENSFFLDSRNEIHLRSLAEIRHELGKNSAHEGLPVMVEDRNGEVVGAVRMGSIIWDSRSAEIRLAAFQDKDYSSPEMMEACRMILQHMFRARNLGRIFMRSLETEKEYGKLLGKVGFVHEGFMREVIYIMGRYIGIDLYGMLREEAPGDLTSAVPIDVGESRIKK